MVGQNRPSMMAKCYNIKTLSEFQTFRDVLYGRVDGARRARSVGGSLDARGGR